jgi:hypothetical protein
MLLGRWNFLLWVFAAPIALILLHQLLATTWSNKCDPNNVQFYLMKNDAAASFRPPGELFTWENDGPDNSWLCSDASLSVSHVGPNQNAMFDATKGELTRNGWSELGSLPNEDFAVLQKVKDGVTVTAILRKQLFWVEVDMNVPGLHPGEFGFGN